MGVQNFDDDDVIAGRLVLGASSPATPLHVQRDGTDQGTVSAGEGNYDAVGYIRRNSNAGGVLLGGTTSGQSAVISPIGSDLALLLVTFVGGLPYERVRVAANGNVGIGTPTPGERLEVNGNIKAAGNVEAAQNKRLKVGDANLSSGSSPAYHWAHLGVNVWFDGQNWQTDDPDRVKGLIQLSNGELSFFVSNTGTPVTWTRRFRVSEQGDVYVNEVRAIRSDGIANKAYYAEPE